jgi:hypothetical protein
MRAMKIITATVLDATHLELRQPLSVEPGKSIQLYLPEDGEDETAWRELARERFAAAYADEDAISCAAWGTLPNTTNVQ